ncbi:MAG: M28 family peptidase [Vicinamibacterales bacterium]|nr:M28 family peptidase [Vicinamibacterales bacterium]
MRRFPARPLTLVLVFLLAACAGEAQQQAASGFDSTRAYTHLREMVLMGPRPAGSPGAARNRAYILEELKRYGIAAVEQPFVAETPLGRVSMVNIIATLPGTRPERIAFGTHYDTKLFREFRFVGANDGASSTAAVLELARVLKDRPRPFTLEFIFFDGEEAVVEWREGDHTYGSRHYVAAAQKAGTLASLKAFILLDMIGDRNLNIMRESYSTRWLTDLIWAAAHRIGHGQYFLAQTTPIEDDHIPFLKAGVPAVDIIDLDYPAWHTAGDTLDKVSARSLQIVGDVVLAALPDIEARLIKTP